MTVTRRDVFDRLAKTSDADAERTTTAAALASALDADKRTVAAHLDGLEGCELVRRQADGRVRVTVTGEELLALDVAETVIVTQSPSDGC